MNDPLAGSKIDAETLSKAATCMAVMSAYIPSLAMADISMGTMFAASFASKLTDTKNDLNSLTAMLKGARNVDGETVLAMPLALEHIKHNVTIAASDLRGLLHMVSPLSRSL